MSARLGSATDVGERFDGGWFRYGALAAVAVLTATYGSVLYHVTDVVGTSSTYLLVVAGTLVFATVLASVLSVRRAVALALALLVGGLLAYLYSIPESQLALLSPARLANDTLALLTGLSVLRLTEAGVWAMAITPGPFFLSWYMALKRRYVWSVVAGGSALGFFVLTGDAGALTTVTGVAAAVATVGLGTLDRQGGASAQLDRLTMVVAAVVLLSVLVPVAPGGASQPLVPDRGTSTIEASLVDSQDRIEVLGSIRLSPKVRFTVESPRPDYWETAAYDRYTGDGWVRTGEARPYEGRLEGPPGAARTLEQTVRPETELTVMPAAWRPVSVGDPLADTMSVTTQGSLEPRAALEPGERYTVVSRVPQYTREQLRRSGTDYPERVQPYLQLPASTTDRVRERAADIAGEEDNPYDKAVAVREWLKQNKRYSLTVERPEGDVADSFLFEMDAGYCTYYATTMVVLLRSQGVPARFVTGYTPGEATGNGEYVVRGLNSHAWVEVYFPDVGWVRFDPTPSGPRQSAERTRLAEARQSGESGVDTGETEPTPTPTPTPASEGASNGTVNVTAGGQPPGFAESTNRTPQAGLIAPESTDEEESSGGLLPEMPSRGTVALVAVAVAGLVAGARRSGAARWTYRTVWMWVQGRRGDPVDDVERAFARLEYLLERRYRPRRTGETPRAYLQSLGHLSVDERAIEVTRTYERAHYRGTVSREAADEAIRQVDEMVREATPVVGRLFRRRRGRRPAASAN